jgi:hypothetical protein
MPHIGKTQVYKIVFNKEYPKLLIQEFRKRPLMSKARGALGPTDGNSTLNKYQYAVQQKRTYYIGSGERFRVLAFLPVPKMKP